MTDKLRKVELTELSKHITFDKSSTEPQHTEITDVKRGEVYMADLSDFMLYNTNITSGNRPVLIIQNEDGNKYSNNVIIAKITSTQKKYPMHMDIKLQKPSIILFEQLMTMPKSKLLYKMGELNIEETLEADGKLMFSLGLNFYNLESFEVISKSTYMTKNCDKESVMYEVKIKTSFNEMTVQIPFEDIEPLGRVTTGSKLSAIEKKLDCIQGLKIINKAIIKASKNI